ncbi:MAG: hypothetical protein KVP17_005278 [Porospora cf. gigantea B]|uniref:uncharacterized protein n=1 Tax=Porospora cf. gigantea B TaxID=2853592 RepID=UPI003571B47C|nr:MAG: hypothetical protein KVP17_005278 [Porospora cf. gigantea B]
MKSIIHTTLILCVLTQNTDVEFKVREFEQFLTSVEEDLAAAALQRIIGSLDGLQSTMENAQRELCKRVGKDLIDWDEMKCIREKPKKRRKRKKKAKFF